MTAKPLAHKKPTKRVARSVGFAICSPRGIGEAARHCASGFLAPEFGFEYAPRCGARKKTALFVPRACPRVACSGGRGRKTTRRGSQSRHRASLPPLYFRRLITPPLYLAA